MAQKTCYVKCVSNEQAQKLRGGLLGVGFVDDVSWNSRSNEIWHDCVALGGLVAILTWSNAKLLGDCIYTVAPDENLTEAAVKIKELFDSQ